MPALRAFVQAQEATILKPLDGMGGAGIFRVSPHEANLSVILETLTQQGTRMLMAQRYIPAIDAGDKRILLIHGEAVPYALARIPAEGETRGNLAAGGRGVAMPLTAREREIVAAVAPKCVADGLFLVGLDVIGGYLTEINVTSPTCFQEISQQTDFDVAGYFVAMLEKRCAAL
jgi:glutathione synthase